MAFIGDPKYQHDSVHRIGVLLVNLGTPDAPTAGAVRRYLRQFLTDPRVIEIPKLLWRILLETVILRLRPARSARAYRQVWTEQGSPLLTLSQALADAVQADLERTLPQRYRVMLAMNYGKPTIDSVITALRAQGARRLVVLPLYPQYSATTTASVYDAVARVLTRHRFVPDHHFVASYYQRPDYIAALAASVRAHWAEHGRGDRLLMSFHGIPKRYFLAGDPYHCHCHGTAQRLAAALDLSPDAWQLSFQSRVGREEWLRPYTDHTVRDLAVAGVRQLDVICPAFAVDCLETLEEIKEENAETFIHAGGTALRYIACLNAQADHAAMLSQVVREAAHAWLEAQSEVSPVALAEARHQAFQSLQTSHTRDTPQTLPSQPG